MFSPIVMMFLLTLGVGVVILIIAADKARFLARFDLKQWRAESYLRSLPNFLQELHDNHFKSAFPPARNAVAAKYFDYRAGMLLKKKPRDLRRAFLHQHIILFGLLENLRPYLEDFILNERLHMVGDRVVEMEDTAERDRLLSFLESIRQYRARFFASLSEYDRQTLIEIIDRRLIPTLRRIHVIFEEHGFTLLPEFNQLSRWEGMSGVELALELPALPFQKNRIFAERA